MKLSEYCECGGQMAGTVTPDNKAVQMKRIFWEVHSGQGHSPVKPSKCYAARRKEETEREKEEWTKES